MTSTIGRANAVLCELSDVELAFQYQTYLRASCDPIFGHASKRMLALVEAEIKRREEQK